MNRRAKLKMNK